MRHPRLIIGAVAIVAVTAGVAPSCQPPPEPGLVSAYGFEDGAGTSVLDASTLGHTGTVRGGATWTTAGKFGKALEFDGVDDQVDIPSASSLALTTGMTLEAWVRPTAQTGWRSVLLKERVGGLSYALYSSDSSGRPNTTVHAGGADSDATANTAIPLNTWSHLAATYDGTTMRLFVNGAQVSSRPLGGASITASTNMLRIGGNEIWGEHFKGTIDEVRIFDRARTPEQITSDMGKAVGPGKVPPAPPGADTVGRWTGPTELGLVAVNMVYLHTGKVLVFRGMGAGGTSASVWDPVAGSMKSVPAPYNIFCSGHSQLADGRILVVGGHDSEGGVLGSAKAAIFDPVAETWTSVPSMSQRRWYPSATTLPDGRILVTSGAKTELDEIADVPEIYDPATNSWTQLNTAKLAFPYYPFSFVLPDGQVLIAGAGEHPAPTRKLNVATQQWTMVDPAVIEGGSAAMFAPGKVMKSGTATTTDFTNVPTEASTYVLDATAASPAWRQTAPMAFPRAYHTLTPLPDDSVIVTGGGTTTEGKDISAAVYEAEIWSPGTETWKTMARMTVPRLYHGTALLLADGRVAVAGSGDSYGGPDQTTAEFFEPPYLFKGARPALTGVPATVAHGATFSASTSGTISKVSLLRLGAVTHQFDEDARTIPLAFTQAGNQLSIKAPTNANIAPPGYYMVFAVNAAGVPSVASFVKLPKA